MVNSFFYSSNDADDLHGYFESFGVEGTIRDIDKQSVRYKINGKDYGYVDAKCIKKQEKYRLAVAIESATGSDGEIELL